MYRFEEIWRERDRRGFVIECSSGTYVRSLIADLGDAYCEQLRRTRIGEFDVADADPERSSRWTRRSASCPRCGSSRARPAGAPRDAVPGEAAGDRPADRRDGLIALAESGGELGS